MRSPKLGATVFPDGIQFGVWSEHATLIELCIYGADGVSELSRAPMEKGLDNVFRVFSEGLGEGTLYGFRAHGDYEPDQGLWFDPSKLDRKSVV